MKKWKKLRPEPGPVIDHVCPVCKRPAEINRDSVLDTDTKPWRLYHKVCYRMAHPKEKRKP